MKGNKAVKIVLLALLGALGVAVAVLVSYLSREWNRTTYFDKTTINGFDVSERKPEDVLHILTDAYSAPKITLRKAEKRREPGHSASLGIRLIRQSSSQGFRMR